ncbi:MAG: hypothetical protein E6G06_16580 [Actinobacteria bacterium]|nr:MAG: hypothetical protein E6G06_16580 [Actinomycetota bacterium]
MSVTAWSMRRLVDAAVDVGHERVDDLLHVDALGLGHLGDGLATAQLVAQVGLADPDRLGDDRGLGAGREARAPAEALVALEAQAFVHQAGDAVLQARLDGGGALGGDALVGHCLVDARCGG